MLKLTLEGLDNRNAWENAGVKLPDFNITDMRKHTKKHPVWVHFGAGNIFRGYIARLMQELINKGIDHSGIIVAETYDREIIERIYIPNDNLTLLVGLNPDGDMDKIIIASIATALYAVPGETLAIAELVDAFENPSLQVASFTITEKGYSIRDTQGNLIPAVAEDMENGPGNVRTVMGWATALAFKRYLAGSHPLALLSLDNCSRNGEKLRSSIREIATVWEDKGLTDSGFTKYLTDEDKVTFPWSMIDKITPHPSEAISKILSDMGLEGASPIRTGKNTFIAPFVNAEIPEYLVIEDSFPNGRPALESARVFFTNRETVNKAERMKVTTCLNPLHTALAVFGCLLGYKSIAEQMKDPDMLKLVERLGYNEGLPVVDNPEILNPKEFLDEVITVRLPNPFIPDTPQRIATDTSQKISIRYGETIKAYLDSENKNASELVAIPMVIAGWLRYLLGVNDSLDPMPLSSDPMLEDMKKALYGICIGAPATYNGQLKPILKNEALFGVNLYKAGIDNKVEDMFHGMISGKGAVRDTLRRYLY